MGRQSCNLWCLWGAPWPYFIGGQAPWVVHNPAPKFERVLVGFRQPKPTRKLTPLSNPKILMDTCLAPQGNVAAPNMEPSGLPKIARVIPDPSGTFHNIPEPSGPSKTFHMCPEPLRTLTGPFRTLPGSSGTFRNHSEIIRDTLGTLLSFH